MNNEMMHLGILRKWHKTQLKLQINF